MDDLAIRLRKYSEMKTYPVGSYEALTKEAASEIDRLRAVLAEIGTADPLDLALDPEWAQRIARHALAVGNGA